MLDASEVVETAEITEHPVEPEQIPQPASGDEDSPGVLVVEGQVKLRSSMSMLFTDILSQELNSAISAPQTLDLLQKYLRNKPLEQMNPGQLEPLMKNVPDTVIDVVKEAVFCSGAAVKRLDCLYNLRVGDRFIFRASGLIANLEILDGRVVSVQPLQKR